MATRIHKQAFTPVDRHARGSTGHRWPVASDDTFHLLFHSKDALHQRCGRSTGLPCSLALQLGTAEASHSSPPPPALVRDPRPPYKQASSAEVGANGAAAPAPSAGKAGKGGKRKAEGVGAQRNGGGGAGGSGASGPRRKRWRPEELDPMIAAEDAELKVREAKLFVSTLRRAVGSVVFSSSCGVSLGCFGNPCRVPLVRPFSLRIFLCCLWILSPPTSLAFCLPIVCLPAFVGLLILVSFHDSLWLLSYSCSHLFVCMMLTPVCVCASYPPDYSTCIYLLQLQLTFGVHTTCSLVYRHQPGPFFDLSLLVCMPAFLAAWPHRHLSLALVLAASRAPPGRDRPQRQEEARQAGERDRGRGRDGRRVRGFPFRPGPHRRCTLTCRGPVAVAAKRWCGGRRKI